MLEEQLVRLTRNAFLVVAVHIRHTRWTRRTAETPGYRSSAI